MSNELKTPDEFIEYYSKHIIDSLNINDIKANRLGFIGYMFELLGNSQYDVKGYFDSLFVEAFPVTAVNNENLIYHSFVHGYIPSFAKPSLVNGIFRFNFNRFPLIPYDVKRREILISDYEHQLNFQVNGMSYYLDSQYKIIFERLSTSNSFRINCEIKTDSEFEILPLIQSTPVVKIKDLKQYEKFEEFFKIPNYTFGSFYSLIIPVSDYIYDVNIYVKERNSHTYEKYINRFTKSFSLSVDKVVFIKVSSKNELILEFGSGINGKYIPGSDIRVVYKTTKGKIGNIGSNLIVPKTNIRILDIKLDNTPDQGNFTIANNFIELAIDGGYGGENAEVEEILRSNLIKYIQSRENLVSELDFQNIIKKQFEVCEILFKKTDIVENIIYCYIPFVDRYLNPIKTITNSIPLVKFEENKLNNPITNEILIYEPRITIENKEFISPFLFIYDRLLRIYKGYFVLEKNTIHYSEKINLNSDIDFSLSIYLEIEFIGLTTRIWVRSYSDIGDFKFKITSSTLMFNNVSLIQSGNSFYIDYYNKLIDSDSNVILTMLNDDVELFEYKFYNVKSVYSFVNIIRMKPVPIDGEIFLVNVPLIDREHYYLEKKYYQNKILAAMQSLELIQNRMISDEIQLRFLNTFYLQDIFTKDLIIQSNIDEDFNENTSYFFPLKLKLYLDFSKDLIILKNTSVSEQEELILNSVVEHLVKFQTGLNIKFYKTKIVDIIHNNEFIKHTKVELYDNKDVKIVNSNFESKNHKEFIETLNKQDYLHFSPIYYHWDINNIKIISKVI